MRCLTPLILLCLAIANPVIATTPCNSAQSNLEIPDPGGQRPLEGWLWYPTEADSAEQKIAGNAVWAEIRARRDVPIALGRHPLVLLSHGTYGNIYNQGWLAQALASHGYMVAAVNHPGTTSRNRDKQQAEKLWERTRDLSRIVDHLLSDARTAASVDPEKIAASGHSLGGHTVMRLLGAIHDDKRHDESCAPDPSRIDCRVVCRFGVGQSAANSAQLLQSLEDPRIRAVITLDLGGTQTFTPESLKTVSRPVMVIGVEPDPIMDQRLESLLLTESLPAELVQNMKLPGGAHFDFMGICTDRAKAILMDEKPEDVVICENGTKARAQKHKVLVGEIIKFLEKAGVH